MNIKWTEILPYDNRIRITPDGYWTNGHIALKGEPPPQLSKLRDFRRVDTDLPISSIIPPAHFRVPALVLNESNDLVVLRRCDSDINVRMQAIYYQVFKACIKERHVFLVHDAESIILCANLKNEILGAVSPYRFNANSRD